MDRGKAKMTEDDIAAQQRAQRRHSRIAVGESMHQQPSFETNIGSTTTISSSCPLPPNSVLQGMEHLSVSAPRTVQDIRSDLFVGLRDVSSQSVSLWDVPTSVSSPTNSVFQTTNVTLCNVQASSNMLASSVSQQMGQLSATQPLPIDGDQAIIFVNQRKEDSLSGAIEDR